MGTTTKYTLPYPEDGDSVDVPRDVKALAERTDSVLSTQLAAKIGAVSGSNVKVARGSVTFSVNAGQLAAYGSSVSYGTTFTAVPVVLIMPVASSSAQHVTACLNNVTTTAFSFNIKNHGGTDQTNRPLYWLAIGV